MTRIQPTNRAAPDESSREIHSDAVLRSFVHNIGGSVHALAMQLKSLTKELKSDLKPAAPFANLQANLQEEIAFTQRLIEDFRCFIRQPWPDRGPIDLVSLIDAIVGRHCQGESIRIVRQIDPDLPIFVASHREMQDILRELVCNAVEAMPDGGEMVIRIAANDTHLQMEIQNSGACPTDDTDVFAPFVTTKKRGTGLGLAIVRKTAAIYGGTAALLPLPGAGGLARVGLPLSSLVDTPG